MSACVREPELEAALDGRLDPEATRLMFAHAHGCVRCREARAELEGLGSLSRALAPATPDAVRSRRLRAAVMGAALMGTSRTEPRGRSPWLVAVAACAVLLVGVSAWALHRPARAPVVGVTEGSLTVRPGSGRGGALTPSSPSAPPPVAEVEREEPLVQAPAASAGRAAIDPGMWFREGSFAFERGDHPGAVRALGRFLAFVPRSDPRREDASYLRVLSLHALGRVELMQRAAAAYAREFPRGVRRAEVVLAEASLLASSGRCDEAVRAGEAMPADAPVRVREALTRALRCDSH